MCGYPSDFKVVFGWPSKGQIQIDDFGPFSGNVFEYMDVDWNIGGIYVGVPQRTWSDGVDISSDLLAGNSMISSSVSSDNCSPLSFEDNYNWLTLGSNSLGAMNVPVTIEGVNKSPSFSKGSFCNDLHLTWESNRNGYWDIYYANSSLPTFSTPFKIETRITDSQSNSLHPKIALSKSGKRIIVWHDDRDGKYQVYAATGNSAGWSCSVGDANQILIENFYTDKESFCSVSFEFCSLPCEDYGTVPPSSPPPPDPWDPEDPGDPDSSLNLQENLPITLGGTTGTLTIGTSVIPITLEQGVGDSPVGTGFDTVSLGEPVV
jgi:hypothetical protein